MEQQRDLTFPTADEALERTLDELRSALEDLKFVVVDENVKERLVLPGDIGWIEYRPLSGTEIDEFEERRVRSLWRQRGRSTDTTEMEIVADWASAFTYLFRTTILDFEIKVSQEKTVRMSDFRNKDEAVRFLTKLHWKLQRYIGFYILKVSGWEPPRPI